MKYLLILILLVGCSKSTVQPGLTGNWSFSTSSCSGTFSIVSASGGYAVAPNGTFAFNGHSYTTGPNLPLISAGTNQYTVTLRTLVNSQAEATSLQFILTTDSQYVTVTGGNPVMFHDLTTNPKDGSFNITSFPLVRK